MVNGFRVDREKLTAECVYSVFIEDVVFENLGAWEPQKTKIKRQYDICPPFLTLFFPRIKAS